MAHVGIKLPCREIEDQPSVFFFSTKGSLNNSLQLVAEFFSQHDDSVTRFFYIFFPPLPVDRV